jgi:Phycobilisome Linker polypeptide/Domain of unknown function (DUF4214)
MATIDVVNATYEQVLERPADESGAAACVPLLDQGRLTVRDLVRALGLSPEYQARFIEGQAVRQAVALCYKHFLGREPDEEGWGYWIAIGEHQGFAAVIGSMIDSEEYSRQFGDHAAPHPVPAAA